jgi:hypothetical protein
MKVLKKGIAIISSLIFVACTNERKDVDCLYAKKMVDLSLDELSIHASRGSDLLTLDDRIKLFEIEKKGSQIFSDLSKEYEIENQEQFSEKMEELKANCSEFNKMYGVTDKIQKIKSNRNLGVIDINAINSIKTENFKSPCDYMELIVMLGSFQISIYEKENGNVLSENELNLIKKLENKSDEVSTKLVRKYNELECKKCMIYDFLLNQGESLKQWKNR